MKMTAAKNGRSPSHTRETQATSPDKEFRKRAQYVLTLVLGVSLAIALMWFAGAVLLLVFASILIAVLLQGASEWLRRKFHLPYAVSLGVVLLSSAAVLALAGWVMAPQIARQIDELINTIPTSLQRLQSYLGAYGWLKPLTQNMPSPDRFASALGSMIASVKGLFSGALGVVANVFIIAFVSIYLSIRPALYINGLIALLPKDKRQRGGEVIQELGRTLRAWLAGKLLSMIVVGAVTATGLWLLDVPLALTLGVIAGLFDFIPYIGPILAGVPAVLIAFTESSMLALYVALFFVAVQTAEGYLLLPLIERRTVFLPPALTIMMQVLLGLMFGLAGVALATPLTAIIYVLIAMLYVEGVLGDQVRTPGEK